MDDHSRTAIVAAVTRGLHTERAENPILADEIATELYTPEEARRVVERGLTTALTDDQRQRVGDDYSPIEAIELIHRHGAFAAASKARNRYAEDCLETAIREHGIQQYVIIGAGLDTFAFRRPDLTEALTIFELDHPASQQFKQTRLADAGLDPPESLHFVPVDLENESVASALSGTAYAADRPAFFSWLGVALYLSREAIVATLDAIQQVSANGSELVFDFIDAAGTDPGTTTPRIRRFMRMVEQVGEPIQGGLPLEEVESQLNRRGFEVLELLQPADQRRRYFADQPDHLEPTEHYHFVHVRVTTP